MLMVQVRIITFWPVERDFVWCGSSQNLFTGVEDVAIELVFIECSGLRFEGGHHCRCVGKCVLHNGPPASDCVWHGPVVAAMVPSTVGTEHHSPGHNK